MKNKLKACITTEIFQQGQKRMRERTVAEILDINFSYMKVCAIDHNLSDFEATICYIPFTTSYTPNDQKSTINTIIEKKGKGNKVKDLRMINLLEVDFNFNNKIRTRMTMDCIKSNQLLLEDQYKSRKFHKALD